MSAMRGSLQGTLGRDGARLTGSTEAIKVDDRSGRTGSDNLASNGNPPLLRRLIPWVPSRLAQAVPPALKRTSTGAIATANHTIAVDPNVIPYGTKVMINGVVYTAEDKGGGVKGNHIDIFYNTHGETQAQGTQYAEVFVVEA